MFESVKTLALVHRALNMKKNSKHRAEMRRANPIPDHVIFRKYENNKPNPKIEKYDTSENENTVCEGTKNRGKIFSSNCIIDEIVGRDFEKEAKHEACKNVGYEG